MSYTHAYASRRRGTGLAATVWAAKLAFLSAALAAAAAFGRLAVPQLMSAACTLLPRAWAAARVWLVPPYLFVTVHLIILVIWKLSDHRHPHAQAHRGPWAHPPPSPPPHPAVPPAADEAAPPPAAGKAKEFVATHAESAALDASPDSGAGESCVTMEFDEDSSASSRAEAKRSLAPAPGSAVLERESLRPPPATTATAEFDDDAAAAADGDDSMDATWKAIMEKTRPASATAAAAAAPPPPRARDPSVGADEMNRRFDDFIKKSRHSFRRQ